MSNNKKNVKKSNATFEIAELEAKLLAAKHKRVEEEKAARAALAAMVNKLPEQLGLASLKEVINAIRLVNKGVSNGTSNRISDETKANIRAELIVGGKTLREIADSFSVSVPTVQTMKKGMGLVKTRSVTAVSA